MVVTGTFFKDMVFDGLCQACLFHSSIDSVSTVGVMRDFVCMFLSNALHVDAGA